MRHAAMIIITTPVSPPPPAAWYVEPIGCSISSPVAIHPSVGLVLRGIDNSLCMASGFLSQNGRTCWRLRQPFVRERRFGFTGAASLLSVESASSGPTLAGDGGPPSHDALGLTAFA